MIWRRRKRIRIPIREIGGRVAVPVMAVAGEPGARRLVPVKELRCAPAS